MTPDDARQRAVEKAAAEWWNARGVSGLVDATAAAIAAFERALWQPIETAPVDGTLIVGWGKVAWFSSMEEDNRQPERAVEMRWDGDAWECPTPTPYEFYCFPTHWRPRLAGPGDGA
jgi:hypothetical protein